MLSVRLALEFTPYRAGMPTDDFGDLGVGIFLAIEGLDGKTLFVRQVFVGHLSLNLVLTK